MTDPTFFLLGNLDIRIGGHGVDVGTPKQRAVLAFLLLHRGTAVSSDAIVDAVWGDAPPPNVTTSLQAYVSNLRRLLRDVADGGAAILRKPPGYLLTVDPSSVDLDVVERRVRDVRAAVESGRWEEAVRDAASALSAWGGRLLADFPDEEWTSVERARWDDRRIECQEDLATALLALGRPAAAVPVAAAAHRAGPLRERGISLLALALHRSGRTAEALEAYRAHATALDDELGLEPSVDLRGLQSALLRQDPSLDGPAAAPTAIASAPAGVGEGAAAAGDGARGAGASAADRVGAAPGGVTAATDDDFVGRQAELASVEAVLRPLSSVRWVVLTGPAGIGKTRLAEQAVSRAAPDGRVVRGHCAEDEGMPPWWPLRAVLRSLGTDPDSVLTPPPGVDADAARYAVYERLDALIAQAAADHGLVVIWDDLQWADSATLGWLTHLATSLRHGRIALVVTLRSGALPPGVQTLLAALARHPGARQLSVPPLSVTEVSALAGRVSGGEVGAEEALELSSQTGGNAFLVAEYARLPRAERSSGGVPVAVRAVLQRRLSAVEPDVLQMLRAAAVAGGGFDVALLCAVLRVSNEELADLLDEAADAELIELTPDLARYAFTHGLLRDEVLADISAPRRQRLHARLAAELGHGGDDHLARRATHLLAAYPFVDASEVLEGCRNAATDAEARWNSEAAAEWWAAALRVWRWLPDAAQDEGLRDDMLVAQVEALSRSGRRQTVIDVVDAGIVDAMRDGRTRSTGRLAAALLRTGGAWPWVYSDRPEQLLSRLTASEPLLVDDPASHISVLAALAVGSYYDPDPAVPDLFSRRALDEAEALGDPDTLADALLGRALAFSGVPSHRDENRALLRRLQSLHHSGQRVDGVTARAVEHMIHLLDGDRPRTEEAMAAVTAASDALRLPVTRMQMRWAEGSLALWAGDLEHAEELYALALALHTQTEMYTTGVYDIAVMALRWEQGRLERFAGLPAQTQAALPWAAAALAYREDPDGADRLLETVLIEPPVEHWTTLAEQTLLAHLLVDARRSRHAAALRDRLAPFSGLNATFGQLAGVGPVDLALARLRILLGDEQGAREHVVRARALAEDGGGRCATLRSRLVQAELDKAPPGEWAAIATEAERLGMGQVSREAERRSRAGAI